MKKKVEVFFFLALVLDLELCERVSLCPSGHRDERPWLPSSYASHQPFFPSLDAPLKILLDAQQEEPTLITTFSSPFLLFLCLPIPSLFSNLSLGCL